MYHNGMHTLEFEEVKGIHELLVEDFENTKDPIESPGIREDGALLESAVNRQNVGYGKILKYPTPLDNAASLCYGVCCNHGFHNDINRCISIGMI